MPHFVVYSLDKPDSGPAIRAANRAAHLEWAKEMGDKLKVGGPLLDDTDGNMIGSLIIADFESEETLRAHLATDPYAKAGLFQCVDVRPFKWLLGPSQPS